LGGDATAWEKGGGKNLSEKLSLSKGSRRSDRSRGVLAADRGAVHGRSGKKKTI